MSDGEPQRKLELPEFPTWVYRPTQPARFLRIGECWALSQRWEEGTEVILMSAATWRSLAHFIIANVREDD